jgi:secreted trypsin-like serine protease
MFGVRIAWIVAIVALGIRGSGATLSRQECGQMRRTVVAKALAIAVAVVTVGLLSSGQAGAVANGTAATPGQFPFAVKFTMTNIPRPDGTRYNSACSGALIAPQWVLTAGHCFHDVNRVRIGGAPIYATTATLGTVNLAQSGGETRTVVDVRQSAVNDISIAKLSSPITDIVPLVVRPTAPKLGESLVLAGWGATSSTNPVPGTVLNYGHMAVGSVGSTTIGVHGVSPSAFTSACLYDSGAPYFVPIGTKAGQLVSVESDGPSCPHNQLETTARADVIVNWIHQQVAAG